MCFMIEIMFPAKDKICRYDMKRGRSDGRRYERKNSKLSLHKKSSSHKQEKQSQQLYKAGDVVNVVYPKVPGSPFAGTFEAKVNKSFKNGGVKVVWVDGEYEGAETVIPGNVVKKYVSPSRRKRAKNDSPTLIKPSISEQSGTRTGDKKTTTTAVPTAANGPSVRLPTSNEKHLSEYEKRRLKRIAENEKKLSELGLNSAKISNYRDIAPKRDTYQASIRNKKKRKVVSLPVNKRRSSRLKGVQPVKYTETEIVNLNSSSSILEMRNFIRRIL